MRFTLLSELEIMQEAAEGNQTFWNYLIHQYEPVFQHVTAHETSASKVFHDEEKTFLHAHFRQTFSPLKHENFPAWLLEHFAVNTADLFYNPQISGVDHRIQEAV